MSNHDKEFWETHGRVGLIWSNPNASDDQLIAAALLKQPNFHLLLDIASKFGLDRLKTLWLEIRNGIEEREYPEELKQLERAEPTIERFLKTVEEVMGTAEPDKEGEATQIHKDILPHDLARLEQGRVFWKNPNLRQKMLDHWADESHPYRRRFKIHREAVERILTADPSQDDALAQQLQAEGTSLRAVIREIPPLFGSFFEDHEK